MKDLFHTRVVGSEIGVADGPVFAESVARFCLELVVAEPEGLPRPEEGPSAEEAHAHPIVWALLREGVGYLLLIDPDVCVVLTGLEDVLEPVLSWQSFLAQVKQLQPGQSTGYGKRFVASEPTWIGIVPVGYADGFQRNLTGTEVRVGGEPRPVVGTVSMDSLAVQLARDLPVGTPVVMLGHGVLAEAHARVADTINYELVCGINSDPRRTRRVVVDS